MYMCMYVYTGLETFKHDLEVGQAGDQLGALVRGVKREDVRRGMVLCPPGTVTSQTQLKGQVRPDPAVTNHLSSCVCVCVCVCVLLGIYYEEGRGWKTYSFCQQLFSTTLHSNGQCQCLHDAS